MAGIYIHIPFCRKACHYCNFHFSTSAELKAEMTAALAKELTLQKEYLSGQTVETVYFGGGTPSVLDEKELNALLYSVDQNYSLANTLEVTLEANPDDISRNSLVQWKNAGINRLSIGVQAFQDELLKGWNRSHNAAQALMSLRLAQDAGFENITADLIYGSPALTDDDWEKNIRSLTGLLIPHISSYALTVEEKTALAYRIREGLSKPVDDEQANRQYSMLQTLLASEGYIQYEVSNFCKPGFFSRHNSSYWSGAHYLGAGPSAHSYNGRSRQWNVSNNVKYLDAIRRDTIPFEKEELTPAQLYNEIVMTGLRTAAGIDMRRIKKTGAHFEEHLHAGARSFVEKGKLLVRPNGNYALYPEHYFFADGLAAALFL